MYKITFYLLNIFGHNLSIYNIFKENTDLRLLIIVKIIKSSSLEAVIQSCQLRQELVYLYLQTQTLKLLQRLLLRGRAVIFSFWVFLHFNDSRMEPVTQQQSVTHMLARASSVRLHLCTSHGSPLKSRRSTPVLHTRTGVKYQILPG